MIMLRCTFYPGGREYQEGQEPCENNAQHNPSLLNPWIIVADLAFCTDDFRHKLIDVLNFNGWPCVCISQLRDRSLYAACTIEDVTYRTGRLHCSVPPKRTSQAI